MRRQLFGLSALVLMAAVPARAADGYADAVRCHDAAAAYAQQFVVAGMPFPAEALNGYSRELKGRAVKLGAAQGKSPAAVQADFHDDDVGYVKKFFAFSGGKMTTTDFGAGEVAYCHLDKVLPQ